MNIAKVNSKTDYWIIEIKGQIRWCAGLNPDRTLSVARQWIGSILGGINIILLVLTVVYIGNI